MFVHVRYGNECGDRIMEFNNHQFIAVNNVRGETYIWRMQYSTAAQ